MTNVRNTFSLSTWKFHPEKSLILLENEINVGSIVSEINLRRENFVFFLKVKKIRLPFVLCE